MPSTQPEVHRYQETQAQAKTLRRLRQFAISLGNGSADSAFTLQKLKIAPVSLLDSRICKEVFWNQEFAAHHAP